MVVVAASHLGRHLYLVPCIRERYKGKVTKTVTKMLTTFTAFQMEHNKNPVQG